MVYMCSNLLFYVFFLLLCDIDCLQKTRGIRSPQSAWFYDQQEQTNNKNINSFDIIVLEVPGHNQSPSNKYESEVAGDKVQLLSLLYDGTKQTQNRLQGNFHQQNLKPLPLEIEPYLQHHDEGQADPAQPVQSRGPLNTQRDSSPSDSWRRPGPPPPPEPDHPPFSDRMPPHPPPSDYWRPPPPPPPPPGGGPPPPPESDYSQFHSRRPPPPPPGSGPPPPPPVNGPPPPPPGRGPPPPPEPDYSHEKYREQRDPPPHSRGRGPPPHARGRGPPHKEFGPPRPNWKSDPEDKRNTYNERSDSEIKAAAQMPSEKTNGQDPEYDNNNNNAVYNRNQGRGVPLTNNQAKAEKIQQSRPQPHLFQVVPVTPES